jgi:hypothetical protein
MTCVLILALLLTFAASACGAPARQNFRSSGALSSGEVILGESDMASDAADMSQNPSGDSVPASNDPVAGPQKSAQTGVTEANPTTASTAAPTEPAMQAEPSAGTAAIPTPAASKAPDSNQASAIAGIIVRSENILSTSEKEALLKELEQELNGLFGAIDHVTTKQQAVQAE